MKNVLLVIFVLIGSSVLGQNLQKILDQYKDSLSNYGIVALVDNGKSIQTAQIGWASEESPMQIDHRFCIGSVTKLYTATIILKLNELKLLSIDDSIAKFIPPHRFIDGSITIRQLLNHTSGIKDIVDAKLSNASLLDPYFDYSESYILNLIDTIDFAKGTKHSYSNSNYFLLRKIIERVTEKPYESVLGELIIKPLNLTNTFPYHSNNIDSLAHPILGKQDFHDLPKIGVNQISIGIGNVVSTAADVNAFIRSLFMDNRILNSNSLKTMTTFKTFNESTVGLGVFQENFGGRTVQGHSGRTISYIAYAFVDKPKRISFVLICNNANDPYIDKLIEKVCDKGKW